VATPEERLLALAVARGLVEPAEALGASLDDLVSSGRLAEADRDLLAEDLETFSDTHWSVDMTGPAPEGSGGSEAPTWAGLSGASSEALAGIRASKAEGLFRAKRVAHWGRYESLELVGEGGMGRIFRAEDPKLRRTVALKLLRRDDPELLRRFLQEAQLQARVDHPNVCRVYEVGEWRGQPYIAMQYVRGESLREAGAGLPRETLLELMVQVCEGVHAAHRVGLVHRDLKPANLMVERTEEGGVRACVLDFGLARGQEGGGVTQTGHVMGTVSFMSPEQARGESGQLDRRSDVYALGATLHTLLAGRPPFEGEGLDCMARIVKDDPAPLRRFVPDLPADLETVVLSCLEKDPRRRYPTARALGEDLHRILDGEPIQARPTTRMERIVRWARKRKATVTAVALVLLAALVFGGFAVRERIRSGEQTAYVQRFAQEAERIEALARYLRLQPARDLSSDQADLRARVGSLQAEVRAAGSLAEAPGAYALGRAHLALDEPAQARQELERAWSLGIRTPEAAHALGRALAALYQAESGKAYGLPDPQMRQRRIAELDRTLREPAATWLRQGAAATLEPPAYREGLLALMQGDARRAADLAQRAQDQAPWFYEALRLEAEAQIAEAHGQQDPRVARTLLARAGALLAQAEARAPCDVDLLRLEMRQRQEAVVLNWQTEADPRPLVQAELEVADRWARLEPAAAQPMAWEARACAEEARYLSQRDRDPDPWLSQADQASAEALRRDSRDLDALTARAAVLRTQGFRLLNEGQDPTGKFKAAVQVADEGLRLDPSQVILMNIRSASLLTWIRVTGMQGTYSRQEVLPFLEASRRLAQAHPSEPYYQGNLGGLAQAMATAALYTGGDPRAEAREAVMAYGEGLKAQPHHVGFHRGVLIGLADLAMAQARDGEDPGQAVAEARRAFQAARAAGAPLQSLAPFLAQALTSEASWRKAQGRDAKPILDEIDGLAPLLAHPDEDVDMVAGIRLKALALRIQVGPSARAETARGDGRGLAALLAHLGSSDPAVWAGLAAFNEACGDREARSKALARAKALDPAWRNF
jgi:serine/threonine-protein kinase